MLVPMCATSAITAIVEGMLPRFSPDTRVLTMSLDVRIKKHGDDDSKEVYRNVHLMFHRPSNYTKAMWKVLDELDSCTSIKEWEVKSDHDSCWRTDGLDTPLFDLVHGLVSQIDDTLPHRAFSIEISFGAFGDPKLRELEYVYDRNKRIFTVKKFGKCLTGS